MDVNSTIALFRTFPPHTAFFSASHAPTRLPKTVKPNALFAVNDIVRTLLFQASMPSKYWVESLYTATYLLNRLPTKALTAPVTFSPFFPPLRHSLTYAPLVAYAIRTALPLCLTNSRIARSHVSSSGMLPIIVAIGAWILSLAESSSRVT
jgi:hypothetical protein